MLISYQYLNIGIFHILKKFSFLALGGGGGMEKSGTRAKVPLSQEVAGSGQQLPPLDRPALRGAMVPTMLCSQT